MTQDEIIFRLKSIVHGHQEYTTWTVSTPHLVMLVNSAIEMEREACAKVVDDNEAECIERDVDDPPLKKVAFAIRARGQE